MNDFTNIQKGSFYDFGSQRGLKSVATFSVDCFNTLKLIFPRLWVFKGIQHQGVSNY